MSEYNDTSWGLVLPFDTDDPEFARGCEIGMVWTALRFTDDWDSHSATVRGSNAEMISELERALERGRSGEVPYSRRAMEVLSAEIAKRKREM